MGFGSLLLDVDAALIYGNQDEVGQGIKASNVPREEIFVTSKVRNRLSITSHGTYADSIS